MFQKKFVRQESMKDCGAACLLMIMKRYGGNYPLERLCEMMKMDKNGIAASNLIETAKSVGFDARGYKIDNYNQITYPSIAHVIIDKIYHHFVVIDKVDLNNKMIKIIDPAVGTKRYSFSDFDQIWTRVIITLYPIRKIDNIDTSKNIRKTMYQIITPYYKTFIYIFMLSIIYTALNIVGTFYFKIVIDNKISTNTHLYLFLLFLILAVIKIVTDFCRNKLLISVNQKIEKNLMANTFKHLLSLPWQYFNSRSTGDIIARINDLSYVRELISRLAIVLLVDLVLVIGSIIAMCYLNTTMFLLTIITILIYVVVIYAFSRSINYLILSSQEKEAMVSTSLIENVSGINTIKNLGIENEMYEKVMGKYNDLVNNHVKFDKKYNIIKLLKDFIINAGMIMLVFVGGLFISNGTLSISEFVIFNFFLAFFLEPIKNLLDIEPLFKASINALKRTSEFFNIEKDNIGEVRDFGGCSLNFNNISFSYNNKDKVIQGINFNINNGEKIMISGPSGSGKSTLAKMLMRYLDVKQNQIIVNNIDILKYSLATIRQNICYVSQREMLFTDSLYNNVVLNRKIKESAFDNVVKTTHLDEIMIKHNLDQHMLLEENGFNLSGGEKQRILIARALLKDSSIFIFDETMSEMNVLLERNILQKIFEKYNDKTFIVISHRLDNKDLYDRVIMVNDTKKQVKEGVIL